MNIGTISKSIFWKNKNLPNMLMMRVIRETGMKLGFWKLKVTARNWSIWHA
jgi:hypothetical protein